MMLALEIAKILRGGLEVSATLFKFGLEPTMTLILAGGFAVGGILEFVMKRTELCINAFVEICEEPPPLASGLMCCQPLSAKLVCEPAVCRAADADGSSSRVRSLHQVL